MKRFRVSKSKLLVWCLTLAALPAAGCAAMHAERIKTLRANGDHQQADCYQRCAHDDLICLKRCENAASAIAMEKNRAQFVQLATAAAQVDAAKAAAARSQPPPESAPTELGTSASDVGHGSKPTPAPSPSALGGGSPQPGASDLECPGGCPSGQKCVTYFAGTQQCAPGPRCWVVEKTNSVCKAPL